MENQMITEDDKPPTFNGRIKNVEDLKIKLIEQLQAENKRKLDLLVEIYHSTTCVMTQQHIEKNIDIDLKQALKETK